MALELVRACASLGALLLGLRWGIDGVGWALVVAALVLLPVQLGAARVLIPIRIVPYLKRLSVPVAGAVIMTATVVGLRMTLENRLPAAGLLGVMVTGGAIVYAAAVWLMSPALAREALGSVRDALPVAGWRGTAR